MIFQDCIIQDHSTFRLSVWSSRNQFWILVLVPHRNSQYAAAYATSGCWSREISSFNARISQGEYRHWNQQIHLVNLTCRQCLRLAHFMAGHSQSI